MKWVHTPVRARRPLGDDRTDVLGAISADVSDLACSHVTQFVEESLNGLLLGALTSPDQLTCVMVNHHNQVFAALAISNFIDTYAPQPI